MVRRALTAGAVASPLTVVGAFMAGGWGAAWSAGLGLAIVVLNFAAHGLSLAWASRISVTAVQAVALGGVAVRLGLIAGLLFALDGAAFFMPEVFAVTVVLGTVALLAYEVRLVQGGLGGALDIPPDPAAAAAAERLRIRESGP
jgi:hypothetical protein